MSLIKDFSFYIIPAIIFFIIIYGLLKKQKLYELFIQGAKEGVFTVFKIIPAIIGLMVAVGMLRASGAFDMLAFALAPMLKLLNAPPDILPLALLRPFSGSAAMGIIADIYKAHGPDSYTGRLASIMAGSSETIFYTISVYYGVVGIKDIRYTLKAALIADLAGVLASLIICSHFFG